MKKNALMQLYRKRADGSGEAERLSVSDDAQTPSDWSPDGKHLAFSERDATGLKNVYLLPADGDGKPAAFVETPFDESDASFSSDGRFLAYMSDESGRYEIYVQPYPGPGAKTQVSTEGGQFPIWNPADRELFYRIFQVQK